MELLSASRLEGIRLIREQLCCMLCERIFDDPQCLDCKHNFCRECIYVHLRKNESKCPTCKIPIFPSEIMRNQFLESILVAWKAVETELSVLDANRIEFGLTTADTDRALGSLAASAALSSALASPTQTAATSSGAAIAAALVGTTPSRGPVANRKWNVNTAAILNEQKQPKRVTGIAASPMRATATTEASQANDDTPGPTQMTQMTPTTGTASRNGTSPSVRVASRRRSIFSPGASGMSPGRESVDQSSSSASSALMSTQEVEHYLERIQMQNNVLREWEQQSRRRPHATASSSQNHKLQPPPPSQRRGGPSSSQRTNGNGISAMERLMKNWVTSGNSQSSAPLPAAAAATEILLIDDSEDDDDDDESQTQMPPSGFADSPDLLATSGAAFPRLSALTRTGVVGGGGGTSSAQQREPHATGLEESSRATTSSSRTLGTQAATAASPRRQATASAAPSGKSKRSVANSDVPGAEAMQDGDNDAVEDTQDAQTVLLQDAASRTPRRKKARSSHDFAGAISAFRSTRIAQHQTLQQQQQQEATAKAPTRTLTGALVRRSSPALAAAVPTSTALVSTPRSSTTRLSQRPPLPRTAQQLAAQIRESSKFTLIATDLSNAECKRISTACALLGGRFGLKFDLRPDPVTGVLCSSVTHVIAKSVTPGERRCKRTAKYMRALAEGCLVMDYAWVEASLEAGRWLPEDAFEMIGDAYSTSIGKPRESFERRRQTGQRHDLFQTFRFVLLCDEHEFDYQLDTLRGVVVNFGASVISAAQFQRLPSDRRRQKTQVGIVGRATAPADAKTKWETYQIPIVRVAWLFECISHLAVLPYEEFYPYF